MPRIALNFTSPCITFHLVVDVLQIFRSCRLGVRDLLLQGLCRHKVVIWHNYRSKRLECPPETRSLSEHSPFAQAIATHTASWRSTIVIACEQQPWPCRLQQSARHLSNALYDQTTSPRMGSVSLSHNFTFSIAPDMLFQKIISRQRLRKVRLTNHRCSPLDISQPAFLDTVFLAPRCVPCQR